MTDQVGADRPEAVVEPDEATTGERLSWLARNTRVWLIILVLLVVAGVVVAASYAAFTSTSANAGNIVATGSLVIDDDIDNGAILEVSGLVPGETAPPGQVTISNVGESSGTFTLRQENVADIPGPNGGALSTVLQLQVVMDPGTATERVLYDDLFSGMSTIDLGEWEGGDSHSFDFIVTFPEGGDDNEYQESQVSTTYIWDAVTG